MASDMTLVGSPSWVSGPNGWNAVQFVPITLTVSAATTQEGDAGTPEIQTLTLTDGASYGLWHVTGSATLLQFNASGTDVQAVLDALLGSSVVTVSRSGSGTGGSPYVYTITWLANGDQTQLTGAGNTGGQVGQVASGTPINIGGLSAFTWCYWMRLDSNVDAVYLLSKDNGSHSGSDFAHINGFVNSGTSESYTPSAGITAVYTIPDTAWHFYLWTWNGTSIVLYVDNMSTPKATVTTTLGNNSSDMFIGGENVVNVNSAITISQMRTYDAALGSTDRGTLNSAGEVTANQIGRWKFSEGSGSTVAQDAGSSTTHNLTATFDAAGSATSALKANAHLDATFNATGAITSALKANAHLGATFDATAAATSVMTTRDQLSGSLLVSAGFTATLTGGTPVASGNKIISPYAVY